MKHKSTPQETDQSQQTIDGPGSQLRRARERQELDQAKVAAQLHLSLPLIEALEWDDYEKLPAAVFVQGYLRNYARMLGVDEDSVIRAYQDLQPNAEQQPLPRNQPDQVAQELHNEHRLGTYITWGVLLVVGILVFFWWQGRMDGEETTVASNGEEAVFEPGFAPEPSASMQQQTPEEGMLPSIGDMTPPREEEPAVPDDTAFGSEPSAELPELVPTQQSDEPAEPAEPIQPAEPLMQPAMEAPPAPVPEADETVAETLDETPPPVASTAGQVVFEFSGPCWVEVRDTNGRARIIGMMRDGSRRSLASDLGPFRVVIGDIHVVQVSVNGEAYDLGRHTRGKVARFTLDPSRL